MRRVMLLTKYGSLAASTRQRFLQYADYMAEGGFEFENFPLLDNVYLEKLFKEQTRSLVHVISRYLQRIKLLISKDDMDILWVHCELFPYLPGLFELLAKVSGKVIVFDYDDAIFHNYDQSRNLLVRVVLGKKLHTTIGAAAMVFAGNEYLAAYARNFCDRVAVVPTVVDVDIFQPIHAKDLGRSSRIGWIGTPSTWKEFMAPMLPVLAEVAAGSGSRIMAVGAGEEIKRHRMLDVQPWSKETEIALIQKMDIGIMPLDDSAWARGKCGYKLIQYMACGLPVIASPVGVNSEIVEHGVNGFLAKTDKEWREALVTLIQSPELRRRMGEAGRKKVVEQYSLQVWAPRVVGLLQSVVEGTSA